MGIVARTTCGLLGLLASLLLCDAAGAQTASILPNAKTQFLSAQGAPLAGGLVYTCVPNVSNTCIPGSFTPKTTWQDAFQTIPNANPIVLDSAGSAFIFGAGSYAETLYDASGNLVWSGLTLGTAAGTVIGPSSTTVGHIPIWANANGTALSDPTSISTAQNFYFGTQAPFCDPIAHGAIPDGVTNSLAAFNACLTALGNAGGTIWLDAQQGVGARFCLKAASQAGIFNVNVPVRILSATPDVQLSSCGSGFSVMEVSAEAIMDGFYILGPGEDGASTFGASEPALILTAGAGSTKLFNMFIYGGSPTLQWNCGECQAYNVNVAFAYAGNASGIIAEWYIQGGGGELYNVSADDNEYPYGTPAPPFTYTAWATNQSVATNAVRTATCQDGNSYVIQAKVGGTTASSGTGPTCNNYGGASQVFLDGSVQWSLSHPTLLNHWQIDTGAADVHIHQADTGGGNIGFAITNTLAGNAPNAISCVTCNGGVSYSAQVDGTASGSDIVFLGDLFGGCLETGCSTMKFESTFSGGVTITGGRVSGSPNGISIAGGTNYRISGVDMTGNTTALAISGSANKIAAVGNDVSGATTGVTIAGTASDVIFAHNVGCVSGSTTCVSVTSSGANIVTSPNDDGTAFNLGEGQTTVTGASAATGDMFYRNASGVLTRLPVCTGTKVIGAGGGVPTCVSQGGTGAAWTFLCSIVASNSAVMSYAAPTTGTCTIDNTYTSYVLILQNILPATNERIMELQVHSGGAFKTSGYNAINILAANSSVGSSDSNSTAYIPLTHVTASTNQSISNSAPGYSGTLTLTNPSISQIMNINGQFGYYGGGGAGWQVTGTLFGGWGTTGVVDGFQVLMDSGNITSGQILVYGVQ
jgi:hypothetical protein